MRVEPPTRSPQNVGKLVHLNARHKTRNSYTNESVEMEMVCLPITMIGVYRKGNKCIPPKMTWHPVLTYLSLSSLDTSCFSNILTKDMSLGPVVVR